MIREVYEETGLTVSGLHLCGIKDWMQADGSRYVVLFYKTDLFHGDLVSSGEGEVRWVPMAELPAMKLADGMENMLRVFLEDTISEHYFYREDGEWIEVLK